MLVLLFAACSHAPPYLATPTTITAHGSWVHAASGMEFPETVAGFQRNAIAHFSADAPDVAVNYRLVAPDGAIDATVYLMPEPLLPTVGLAPDAAAAVRDDACRREFASRLQEITQVDHAQQLQQERIAPQIAGETRPGRLARFAYQGMFAGRPQELRSQLARFCFVGGGWSVEYRFTYPADFQAAGWIASFVAALRWNGALASA